ncbi:hypothetical protein [Ensifer sp. 4252]|uniref:hypothetical protein n=1 Tax=Ensifer sp. 4252 TaxID=3373915 RepID=UPI003D1F4BE5
MKMSLRNSLAALVLSTAVAGIAAPAFADSYYQGIDPHNPPGTQQRVRVAPMGTSVAPVDRMSTGSIYRTAPPRVIYQQPGNDRYQGGDGDYYQGIVPPTY